MPVTGGGTYTGPIIDEVTLTITTPGSTTVTTPATIAYLGFSQTRHLLAMTSAGRVIGLEWDWQQGIYIAGMNRDGGYPMSDGFWESPRDLGSRRRLTHFAVVRDDPTQPIDVTAFCDQVPDGYTVTVAANARWARFAVNQSGYSHRYRLRIPESFVGVSAFDASYHDLSSGFDR